MEKMNFEQVSPQEVFTQKVDLLLASDISEIAEKAGTTDSIYGRIYGRIQTVPSTSFEITFDTTKENFESDVKNLLKEEMMKYDVDGSTEIGSLQREIHIAGESEKDRAPNDRVNPSGGYKSLV